MLQIKLAKDLAADLQRQQLQQQQQAQQTQVTLAAAHNSSSSSRSSRSRLLNPGQILHDSEAVHSMVDFLNQQSLEAARSKGSKGGLTMAAATSSSSSRAAGVALMSGAKGSRAVINYAPYQELETFLQVSTVCWPIWCCAIQLLMGRANPHVLLSDFQKRCASLPNIVLST